MAQISKQFKDKGFVVFPGFLSESDIGVIKSELTKMLASWDPYQTGLIGFNTDDSSQNHMAEEYFRSSGKKVGWFLEDEGVSYLKTLSEEQIRSLTIEERLRLVNKCGHGFHSTNDFFRAFLKNEFREIVEQLDLAFPIKLLDVVQSMFICKPPKIGGAVSPHQDQTYVTPLDETCIAFWIALDDATVENGCLWVVPKSHQEGTACYSIYDPTSDTMRLTQSGQLDEPTLAEKVLPENIGEYIPVEVKKGDLVVFDGRLVHKSEPNTSDQTRHAITFHAIQRGTPLSTSSWLGRFGYWRTPIG